MIVSPGKYLFVAAHKGPYLSIQPLEAELGSDQVIYLVGGVAQQDRERNGLPYFDLEMVQKKWGDPESFLRNVEVKAVIRSSSEDIQDPNVETIAAAAATNASVPAFVIEDFPGNYWPQPGLRLDGLFVETDSVARLHCSRGIESRIIHTTGNPRYDALMCSDDQRLRQVTRKTLGLANEPVMLWAGQPDDNNSYRALERIVSRFTSPGAVLLFRAHHRDEAYANGKYRYLLSRISLHVLDVSSYEDVFGLYSASDLIITQFSSAGVEASHLGVPALFVLFDDLGKEYLRTHKGYDRLPWCEERCSFLIEHESEVADVLQEALFNTASRNLVCAQFRRRFGGERNSATLIAQQIRAVVDQVGQLETFGAAS